MNGYHRWLCEQIEEEARKHKKVKLRVVRIDNLDDHENEAHYLVMHGRMAFWSIRFAISGSRVWVSTGTGNVMKQTRKTHSNFTWDTTADPTEVNEEVGRLFMTIGQTLDMFAAQLKEAKRQADAEESDEDDDDDDDDEMTEAAPAVSESAIASAMESLRAKIGA